MNAIKTVANKGKNTFAKLRDPIRRTQIRHETVNKLFSYQLVRRLFVLTGVLYMYYILRNWKVNFYGTVSRMTGSFANIQMPRSIISPLLKLYCRAYNVNLDEIQANGVEDYNSFNSFFTRKLKEGCRSIEEKTNPHTVVSPCDGTIFNYGTCEDDTMVVVKGTKYKLDEFLFGKNDDDKNYFSSILEKIDERGNELKFILMYLSPGDYHRFHSPAICSTNYRRHIAGNLHTVAPTAVLKYPSTFLKNERVSIFGEWIHGFFTTTFIGATNVGSIVLNFDKDLRTNRPGVKHAEIFDKNYLETSEFEGVFSNNLVIKKKSLKEMDEDKVDITSDLGTFDIKDIIDTDQGQTSFVYNEKEEHEVPYRLQNKFRGEEDKFEEFKYDEYQEELKEKLENSESILQKYNMSNKGIMLNKGQEVGYFNLGSSIMLIFETPKDSDFCVEVGQKIKLGNTILRANNIE